MRAVPFAAVYLIDAQVPTCSGADRYKTTGGVAAQTCVPCLQSLVDPGGALMLVSWMSNWVQLPAEQSSKAKREDPQAV